MVHERRRNIKQVATATAFALVLGVAVTSAKAEDKTSEQQEMSAEHKAMMEAWEKAAKPGPQHQWLARKAGGVGVRGQVLDGPHEAAHRIRWHREARG
jgi:hypothetical protein